MITPTDINQATNFIWYASWSVLALTYVLVLPAALLILYKLVEAFGIHKHNYWSRWSKHVAGLMILGVPALLVLVRCDGTARAEKAKHAVHKLLRDKGWTQVGLSRIQLNIDPQYDASFLLNIINQDPESLSLGAFPGATGALEPGIVVVPGSLLEDSINREREETRQLVLKVAKDWQQRHPEAKGRLAAIPFDALNRAIRKGRFPDRLAYVLSSDRTRCTLLPPTGNIDSVLVSLSDDRSQPPSAPEQVRGGTQPFSAFP